MAKVTRAKVKSCMKSSWLTLATLFGVIGGVILGVSLKQRAGELLFVRLPDVQLDVKPRMNFK
jgi:hypothetical protein